jgi:hypothetical protein
MTEKEQEAIHRAAWAAVRGFRIALKEMAEREAGAARTAEALAARGAGGVRELSAMLRQADAFKARHAAGALGRLGTVALPAVPDLLDTLDTTDEKLTGRVEEALVRVVSGAPDAQARVEAACTSDDPRRAMRAASVLGRLGGEKEKKGVNTLLAFLAHDDPVVAWGSIRRSAELAARTSRAELRSVIVRALARIPGTNPGVAGPAMAALGTLGPTAEEAAPLLQEAIFAGAAYKKEATAALRKIRPGRSVKKEVSLDDAEGEGDLLLDL